MVFVRKRYPPPGIRAARVLQLLADGGHIQIYGPFDDLYDAQGVWIRRISVDLANNMVPLIIPVGHARPVRLETCPEWLPGPSGGQMLITDAGRAALERFQRSVKDAASAS